MSNKNNGGMGAYALIGGFIGLILGALGALGASGEPASLIAFAVIGASFGAFFFSMFRK